MIDLVKAVPASLERHPAVKKVELIGSRRKGTAAPWSDWDFSIETTDFDVFSASLPGLIQNLEPISYLWDPLSDWWTFMMILKGPTKIDLLFLDLPHQHEPPWTVNRDTLMEINNHFWDWILWTATKHLHGLDDMVQGELKKMHSYILVSLGINEVPTSIEEAVKMFILALHRQEIYFKEEIDQTLEIEVLKGLRKMEFDL